MAVYNLQAVYIGQDQVRPKIAVTGVSLNTNSITFTTAGQTYQLLATVTPNNATDQSVTWSTSSSSIATVSATGLVTCVTPGSATITVTTNDGGFTATCAVSTAVIGTYNLSNGIPGGANLVSGVSDISSNGLHLIQKDSGTIGALDVTESITSVAWDFGSASSQSYEYHIYQEYQYANNAGFPIYNRIGDMLYMSLWDSDGYTTDGLFCQASLSPNFDVTTGMLIGSRRITGHQFQLFRIMNSGSKLYAIENISGGSALWMGTLTTPWDITTLDAFTSVYTFPIDGINGFDMSPTGTRLYVTKPTDNRVIQYYTGTARDFSNPTLEYSLREDIQGSYAQALDIIVNKDGSGDIYVVRTMSGISPRSVVYHT